MLYWEAITQQWLLCIFPAMCLLATILQAVVVVVVNIFSYSNEPGIELEQTKEWPHSNYFAIAYYI
jgi:hypothetical protein